jgi:hypothetical protein
MVSHRCTWSSLGSHHFGECRNNLNQIGGACIDKNIDGKQAFLSGLNELFPYLFDISEYSDISDNLILV